MTVTWDSEADLGPGGHVGVILRITPFGPSGDGRTSEFGAFTVGDSPPVLEFVEPSGRGPFDGNVAIQILGFDLEGDPFDVALEHEVPGGGGPDPISLAVDAPLVGLAAAPEADGGVAHTFLWASREDLPGRRVPGLRLIATPDDGNDATAEEPASVVIDVDNNARPFAVMGELALNPDRIDSTVLELTIFDDDSHPVDVILQWKLAADPDFEPLDDLADPADRAAVLADPDERRARKILSEHDLPVEGIVEKPAAAIPADEIQVSALLKTTLLSTDLLVGKRIEALRSLMPAVLASGLDTPGPVAIEPGGATALVGLKGTGELVRVDLATGDVDPTPVATGLGVPTAIAIEADGTTALVTDAASGDLLRVDLANGSTTSIVSGGFSDPKGLALVSPLDALVADDGGMGDLFHVDLVPSATPVPITTGLAGPRGTVVLPGGRSALVAEHDADRIVEVDLFTRSRTVIAEVEVDGTPLMPAFLALRADGRAVYATTDEGSSSRLAQVSQQRGARRPRRGRRPRDRLGEHGVEQRDGLLADGAVIGLRTDLSFPRRLEDPHDHARRRRPEEEVGSGRFPAATTTSRAASVRSTRTRYLPGGRPSTR